MAALLVILSVAPAAAGRQPMAGARHDRSGCPHQNARAGGASAAAATAPATAAKVTKITLPDRVGGPLFNLDRRSSAFDL
jgi:hypothetical protein